MSNTLRRLSVRFRHWIHTNTFWWCSLVAWKRKTFLPLRCVIQGHVADSVECAIAGFGEYDAGGFFRETSNSGDAVCSRCGHEFEVDLQQREDQFVCPNPDPAFSDVEENFKLGLKSTVSIQKGQIVFGGTATNNTLVLQSTTPAQKGLIFLTVNEIRARALGLPPISGGDIIVPGAAIVDRSAFFNA